MADNSWLLAIALKPLFLLAVLFAVYPARLLVSRYMRDGKLKRLLLTRVGS